jgi:hypothetical protein
MSHESNLPRPPININIDYASCFVINLIVNLWLNVKFHKPQTPPLGVLGGGGRTTSILPTVVFKSSKNQEQLPAVVNELAPQTKPALEYQLNNM